MSLLASILIATGIISVLSLSGSVFLFLRKHILDKLAIFLVAFAAGALMGTAFLHLLPQAVEIMDGEGAFVYILIGFTIFFFLENILHWHHSHRDDSTPHAQLGTLSLLGDGAHNFLDGIIIATAFFIDARLGIATTTAIAFHEIPQEMAEYGVLIYAGFSRARALVFNFLSASTVIMGGIVGYLLQDIIGSWVTIIIFFAVGTFLYLAASDFVPEIKKEQGLKKSLTLLSVFAAGIMLMWLFTFIE